MKKCVHEAAQTQAWSPHDFRFVKTLEKAGRNRGVVELVEQNNGGRFVAVKRMPVSWTKRGHDEFIREHPTETEKPWVDVGVVKYLNQICYPYVCELLGTFQDASDTRFAYSFATHGDLFSWVSKSHLPERGVERERELQPLIKEIVTAVHSLHELEIAHCDLSLENIMLTSSDATDGRQVKVQIIDFGMASTGRHALVGKCGKAAYNAPEMHLCSLCSPFPYDAFALGMVILLVLTEEFPWVCTWPDGCKKFEYARQHGLRGLLKKVRVRTTKRPVIGLMSQSFTELVEMLLQFDPASRCTLRSVFQAQWLNG